MIIFFRVFYLFFFFSSRRRHTRYWRDWSSDVCSSDLGDTAVAVHPDDERYRDLVGKTLRLPLIEREIPVVADEHVDPEFGTGAVKVTPAHDPNDYEIGQRHGLEAIDVMTDEARININGGAYAGLDRFEARTKVKEDLDAQGLLVRVEER